jgi:TRAP-type uncharacterized transport system fused permease subunit
MEENSLYFVFVVIAIVFFWGWVAWIVLEWRRLAQKTHLHKTLIERFSAPGDLQAFLVSEGGERLFRSLSIGARSAKEKILASFGRGVIVTLLGISSLVVSLVQPKDAALFLSGGIIIIALGVGLIISGALALGLGRKWGIFDR